MSADARRHRLIEVMGKFAKARPARTLYIVEDLHWVDAASEEVFAKFAETLTATQSMFVGSYRPEYHGRLREVSETTIVLAPLDYATTMVAHSRAHRPTPNCLLILPSTLRSLPPATRSSSKRSFAIWSAAAYSSAIGVLIGSAATWPPSRFPRQCNRRFRHASTG